MIKIAKKHNVSLEAVKLKHKTKLDLPMWYHLGAVRKIRSLNNTPSSKCLRETHTALRVADVLKLANRQCRKARGTGQAGGQDVPDKDCTCTDCTEDRRNGCRNPQRCSEAAATLLEQIRMRWHPGHDPKGDGLSLTT
ncbi:hypothetical protein FOMPIDRAFT_1137230 [Fomitopsis schrenkii]|uniref:Uncharacterized protein n=1 Tax=Fomitopsis schrenkii TaxID=2126942 RepID=S8F1F7_FOMSC|nr:hypothetical protein FOMPIDRAFT_1137230 [Fomitopsis schrenkii]